LLLVIASTVILDSELHGTHYHNTKHHHQSLVKIKVKVTLRLAVYDQSVRLDAKPLEIQTRDLYFN
jgi:hypothetical protein